MTVNISGFFIFGENFQLFIKKLVSLTVMISLKIPSLFSNILKLLEITSCYDSEKCSPKTHMFKA